MEHPEETAVEAPDLPKWMEELLPTFTIEDLPLSYRIVASIVGIETAVKMALHLGGTVIYFPRSSMLLRKKRDELIRRESPGSDVRSLARKYRLTTVTITNILKRSGTLGQESIEPFGNASKALGRNCLSPQAESPINPTGGKDDEPYRKA
jgi:Mor family transcriptional regulator